MTPKDYHALLCVFNIIVSFILLITCIINKNWVAVMTGTSAIVGWSAALIYLLGDKD